LATFELVNHYDQALAIQQVLTTCSCSTPEFSARHLEPGEQASLTVTWRTGHARGPTRANLQVVFQLADGAVGSKVLGIQANIIPDLYYDPPELVFVRGVVKIERVQFTSGRQKDFTIRKVSCSHAAFAAAVLSRGG